MAKNGKFTPTQQRILNILADGLPHTKVELRQCFDELAEPGNLKLHIHNIRKILRPIGQDIVAQMLNRRIHYRHVRLLNFEE